MKGILTALGILAATAPAPRHPLGFPILDRKSRTHPTYRKPKSPSERARRKARRRKLLKLRARRGRGLTR